MAGQLVRRIHGWRFEIPLALILGSAAGFAASVMPTALFQQVPLLGQFGLVGQGSLALGLGLALGWGGYAAMRGPSHPAAEADVEDESVDEESTVRLRRFRRADVHPDAPPRAPIRAHRDLGEPFMDVGAPIWTPDEPAAASVAPELSIPEGDFIDVSGEPFVAPAADVELATEAAVSSAVEVAFVEAPVVAEPHVATSDPVADPEPIVAPDPVAATPPRVATLRPTPRAERQTLDEMMDRLSAGLGRRVRDAELGAPPLPPRRPSRDMRPALRDALDELNRLATRRD